MKIELPLSVSIIAKNEEENIARCLASLEDLSCEIILVYNDCTDGTIKVAESFGAKCIEHDWLGYIEQKNFALSRCTHEWVLCLDADEALSHELRTSIINFLTSGIQNSNSCGASFNRCSYFLGRWIKHGDWYPDRKVRLSKKGKATWGGTNPHDKLNLDGPCLFLQGDLQHFSYPSLRSLTEKTLHYSDIFLETNSTSLNFKPSIAPILLRPLWRFFRGYFLRLGILDGYAGFVIAFSTAYESMLKHGRLWELRRSNNKKSESK